MLGTQPKNIGSALPRVSVRNLRSQEWVDKGKGWSTHISIHTYRHIYREEMESKMEGMRREREGKGIRDGGGEERGEIYRDTETQTAKDKDREKLNAISI